MNISRIRASEFMYASLILVIGVIYYWTAQLGFVFAWKHTNVSAVWPPSAIGFIIIFSLGYRLWPGIWLGAFLANVSYFLLDPTLNIFQVILFSAPIAAGNTLEAVIACFFLKKLIGNRNPLHKVQDILRFMVIGAIGCAVSAGLGSVMVCLHNGSFWHSFSWILLTWWMGDFSGLLTLTPVFWALGQRASKLEFKRIAEFVISFGILIMINGMLFGGKTIVSQTHVAIPHLPLALMVWLTYRFGYWGAVSSILLALFQDITGTHSGFGPFASIDLNNSLLLLQTFLVTVSGTTLLLAAALYERRQTQQEVIFSEQRFRALVENSSDMIVLLNPIGIITYSSPSTERIMGYSKSEHEGHSIFEFIHPESEAYVIKEFSFALSHPGETIKTLSRVKHKNGSWRWIESSGRNLLNDPAVGSIVINYRDVTERKEYEEEKFYLASIIENSEEAVIGKALNGIITSWNKGAQNLYGYAAEEVIGKPIDILVPAPRIPEIAVELEKIRQGQGITLLETQRLTKDGSLIDILVTVSPIKNDRGELIGSSSIARDITERKRIQEAIRENEERLSTMIDSALDAMVGMDEEGFIIFWNPQAEAVFGWKNDEVVGKRRMSETIIPVRYREAHENGLKRYLETEEGPMLNNRVELFGLHRDGYEFPVEITICVARLKGKRIFTAFLRNISDRKLAEDILKRDKENLEHLVEERSRILIKTQEELKQASRLADIGTLAAIIAHELRTPLGVIQMAVHNLKNKNRELTQNNHVSNIEKKVWEGNRIIDNLLTYSRIKPPTYEFFPVLNLLNECISTISSQFQGSNITVRKDYHVDSNFEISIDPNQIREVFINVLNNAYQAMHNKTGEIGILVEKKDQESLRISIQDSGSGIDPRNLENIFRPFFTTKAKGTGLGLPICNEIVNLHHGRIDIESVPEKGTTLHIILPINHKISAPNNK